MLRPCSMSKAIAILIIDSRKRKLHQTFPNKRKLKQMFTHPTKYTAEFIEFEYEFPRWSSNQNCNQSGAKMQIELNFKCAKLK